MPDSETEVIQIFRGRDRREAEAAGLRILGFSYDEIAEEMGVTPDEAWRLIICWQASLKRAPRFLDGLTARTANCLKHRFTCKEEIRLALLTDTLHWFKSEITICDFTKKFYLETCAWLGIPPVKRRRIPSPAHIKRAIRTLELNGYEVRKL